MPFSTFITGLALMSTTGWAQYVLEDDFMADGNFFDQFSFFTAQDPTNGFVQYVDEGTADSNGLLSSSSTQAVFRVDSSNTASSGRMSVRLTSNKAYDTGLIIADIAHMPGSICGAWPAFWMVGPDWPNNGEIDIIEGVNDQTTNDITLHTSDGCSISSSSSMSGYVVTDNCYINAAGQGNNQGCQVGSHDTQNYGDGFNANQGGVYATEMTDDYIRVFFFPRNSIPSDISSGSPDPSSWGQPVALFQGDCDIPERFKQQQIVFDTTFCGDWAGATWGSSSCASKADTCNNFVQNNPSAFTEAYWAVNSLKVYQRGYAEQASTASNEGSSEPINVSIPVASVVAASQTTMAVSTVAPVAPVTSTSAPAPAPTSPAEATPSSQGWIAEEHGGAVGWSIAGPGKERFRRHLAHHKRHAGKF